MAGERMEGLKTKGERMIGWDRRVDWNMRGVLITGDRTTSFCRISNEFIRDTTRIFSSMWWGSEEEGIEERVDNLSSLWYGDDGP